MVNLILPSSVSILRLNTLMSLRNWVGCRHPSIRRIGYPVTSWLGVKTAMMSTKQMVVGTNQMTQCLKLFVANALNVQGKNTIGMSSLLSIGAQPWTILRVGEPGGYSRSSRKKAPFGKAWGSIMNSQRIVTRGGVVPLTPNRALQRTHDCWSRLATPSLDHPSSAAELRCLASQSGVVMRRVLGE